MVAGSRVTASSHRSACVLKEPPSLLSRGIGPSDRPTAHSPCSRPLPVVFQRGCASHPRTCLVCDCSPPSPPSPSSSQRESASCFAAIRDSWAVIRQRAQTPEGLERLSRQFGFCR